MVLVLASKGVGDDDVRNLISGEGTKVGVTLAVRVALFLNVSSVDRWAMIRYAYLAVGVDAVAVDIHVGNKGKSVALRVKLESSGR